jgi:multidrug efflux pump subunit AcrB
MVSATLLTLVVIPAVFLIWKQRSCKSAATATG